MHPSVHTWHHAQLVEGTRDTLPAVMSFLERHGVSVHGNPDVWVGDHVSFSVDDARALMVRAQVKPVAGPRRVFVVSAAHYTPEAQNALLKTIEDAPANSLYLLVCPSVERLLPTLRSRMHTLDIGGSTHVGVEAAQQFLRSDVTARLDTVKELAERDESDERKLHTIAELLSGIERALSGRVEEKDIREGLYAVYRAKRVVSEPGAALKPLLEQMAFLVPRLR